MIIDKSDLKQEDCDRVNQMLTKHHSLTWPWKADPVIKCEGIICADYEAGYYVKEVMDAFERIGEGKKVIVAIIPCEEDKV